MAAIVANVSNNVDVLDSNAFMAVITGSRTRTTSIDGVTWSTGTNALSAANSWNAVCCGDPAGNGNSVAVAVAASTRVLNYSYDCATWTANATGMPSTAVWTSLVFGEGKFVAVSTTSSTAAAYSTDGITFTAATLPSSANWLSVAYDSVNGNFAAVSGGTSTAAAYSTDGTSWSAATLPSSGDWRCVAAGGGTLVALRYNSTAGAYSTDGGANWTACNTLPVTGNWTSIAYGNGVFVAVATGGTVALTSTDGIDWTQRVLPVSGNWSSISYSTSLKLFGAITNATTNGLATSPDGIDWTGGTLTSAAYTSVCETPIKWNSGDTLTINNGAIITVDTDQTKFWKTITINNGKLLITNSSTSTPIQFAMGRNTGATVNSIVPASGLGTVEVTGNWIEIDTGDGTSNQTMTLPYRNHCPCIWVETGSGTGIYEIWNNVTGSYSGVTPLIRDGISGVSSGVRGNFFTQDADSTVYGTSVVNYGPLSVTGGSSTVSKYVTVTSTSGIIEGAAISGTGIAANSVVDAVISATVLRLNLVTTASAGPNTYTVYNPYKSQLTSTIRFGDGTNGNVVPNGAKVRVPNIVIDDLTPASLQTSSLVLSANILLTSGGNITVDKAIFSESYNNFTQSKICSLKNCGFSIIPLISETYNLLIESVGMGLHPDRLFFGSSAWQTRRGRFGTNALWSYISNASVTDLKIVVSNPQALAAAAAVTGILGLSFTQDAIFDKLRLFCLHPTKTSSFGLYLLDSVFDCSFSNIDIHGCAPYNLIRSNNNTFTNTSTSQSMFYGRTIYVAGARYGYDPNLGDKMLDDTKYYFKQRSYRDWSDLTSYQESRLYSVTPYLGDDKFHPFNFGVVNTASGTNVLTWTQRAPSAATVVYEIYRGTSAGFTTRDATTRLYQNGTAATVTATDNGSLLLSAPSNGTTYYYVLRKYNVRIAGGTGSGSGGSTTVTTSGNFNAVATITNCKGKSGKNIILAIGSNFDTVGIVAGMPVSGTGVPANTTVSSVDSYYQITLNNNLTQDILGVTLTFGLVAGMYVFGTNIGQNAQIQSVDSNTSMTVTVANAGTISGTLNFASGTESAEQSCYTHGAATTVTNLLLNTDDFSSASWTKTTTTVTTNVDIPPTQIYFSTAAITGTADRLAATGNNATTTQSITTVVSTQYTFSVYIRSDIATPQNATAGSISFGTATQAFTASLQWQRVSVTFTATGVSTTATITINTTGQNIIVGSAMVNTGATAAPYVASAGSATTAGATEISALLAWSKANSGEAENQGVAITVSAQGVLWEMYMSTNSGFTPSSSNRTLANFGATTAMHILANSNGNVFDTFEEIGGGITAAVISLTTSSNNRFLNYDIGLDYGNAATGYITTISNLCNNNFLHNWDIRNPVNAVAAIYPFGGTSGTTNNNSGLILQNIKMNAYSLPLNNNYLGVICKGVSGASFSPLSGSATTAVITSTTDGLANGYTTIYDTIFNELYQGASNGALALTFNASALDTPPYTLSGASFSNAGRLYFKNSGDYAEYIWPHKIYGVTGFRSLMYKVNVNDCGNDATTGYGIKIEYAINTGSGYGSYKEATPENLVAETLPDADVGFYLKIKLTATTFMKYTSFTSRFVIGETINGATSGATAVIDDEEAGASGIGGTLRLSSVTGTFIPGEVIRSGVTNRATNSATNGFALGPSFTSYIDGLIIFTTVDKTALYPEETPTITLTGLRSGSKITFVKISDGSSLGGTSSSGTSFSLTYDYYANVDVNIVIQNYGYLHLTIPYTLTNESVSIPVQQVIDRNYLNPV
jgi:hypothetical protein